MQLETAYHGDYAQSDQRIFQPQHFCIFLLFNHFEQICFSQLQVDGSVLMCRNELIKSSLLT